MKTGMTFGGRLIQAMGHVQKRRPADSEQGSVILETAMSLMILLTFMFGVMETGLALYAYNFISEAAREGTRYAIVRGSSAGASCASFSSLACHASQTDIKNYVASRGFNGITSDNVTVAYTGYPAGVTCTPSAACDNPTNLVTVTVQYNFVINLPFAPNLTYRMSSASAMIIQS
jgi:Flp pilus assembly protein TadG